MNRPRPLSPLAFLASWVLLSVAVAPLSAEPRALSPAERYGAALAVRYLDQGPAAWWDELSRESPLRALGRDAALEEIEVRAGIWEGATWDLRALPADSESPTVAFAVEMPSGLDDALWLELVEEEGRWRLFYVRSLSEPGEVEEADDVLVELGIAPDEEAAESTWIDRWGPPAAMGLALLFLGLAALGFFVGRKTLGAGALTGALVAAVVAMLMVTQPALFHWIGSAALGGAAPAGDDARLGRLLPLRQALGRNLESSVPLPDDLSPALAETAALWHAQAALARADLSRAEEILGQPRRHTSALANLLEARLGLMRLVEVDTILAWEGLLADPALHDGLLLEAAGAASLLGFEDRARDWLQRAYDTGSRSADLHFTMAELAVLDDRTSVAVGHFEAAFTARPRERAEILEEPLLSFLIEEPRIQRLLDLASPEEPVVECGAAGEPLTVPARFEGRIAGQELRLRAGSTELRLPGGCGLAPAGTPSQGALDLRLTEEREALDRLPELLDAVADSGVAVSPAISRKIERTTEALARRARWTELVELTDPLSENLSSLPPELIWLRAEGLRRTGRSTGARRLLIELAKVNTSENRADPITLYRLADLFTSDGEFEVAERLTSRANSLLPFDASGDRLRRIRLEQRLADGYLVERTTDFELRFPTDWSPLLVRRALYVLEEELERLRRWIPLEVEEPIAVHFLPVDDFRLNYSPTLEVVGVYDGKIRLPFGEVTYFHPILVSILTHELTHAMIALATEDRAPAWFHEGLAQHVQMLQGRLNPIETYESQGQYLAFPLLNAAIGSAHPVLTSVAYDETTWVLHYFEHHHGVRSIHRLLEEFSAGATTREALQTVFGMTPEELDRDFRRWSAEDAPGAWPIEIRRYDLESLPR